MQARHGIDKPHSAGMLRALRPVQYTSRNSEVERYLSASDVLSASGRIQVSNPVHAYQTYQQTLSHESPLAQPSSLPLAIGLWDTLPSSLPLAIGLWDTLCSSLPSAINLEPED